MSEPESTWLAETRGSYDVDATGYAEKVRGLLVAHPHLRAQLDVFAELVRRDEGGPVADVGCGPGYVTRHLHDAGVEAFGVDLSPEMVEIARRDHPDLRFVVGTMTDLDLETESLAGVVAFWSTIHVPDQAMPGVVDEFRRTLRPGGHVLIGFHVGDGMQHSSSGYGGQPISVDTHLRSLATMSDWLRRAGFRIESQSVFRPDDDAPGAIVTARRSAAPTGETRRGPVQASREITVVVDAANCVGSVPDGWWRDRLGATRRLRDAISADALRRDLDLHETPHVVLVVEGKARGVESTEEVRVVDAPGSGDDMIVEVAEEASARGEVVVVTADRGLRSRVERLGAGTVGPRTVRPA